MNSTNNEAKKLTIEEMEPLFEVLKTDGDKTKLTAVMTKLIKTAKAKKLSAADLQNNLKGMGINLTDNFVTWINSKFMEAK